MARKLANNYSGSRASTGPKLDDLEGFYELLGQVAQQTGFLRQLGDCKGSLDWPSRGVYFFFEPGEFRASARHSPRVVRVGTHQVATGTKASFWSRLRTHRGRGDGGGNHRGSVFRLHVGNALLTKRPELRFPHWGVGGHATADVRAAELGLEKMVSHYLCAMSLVFVKVDDDAGPTSLRAFIERNSIALLTSEAGAGDQPSKQWLGRFSPEKNIRDSGLWNLKHFKAAYDPAFLDAFSDSVRDTVRTG